jgi:hypothetical protein
MQPIKSTRFMYIILRVNIKHDENGSDWLKDNLEEKPNYRISKRWSSMDHCR